MSEQIKKEFIVIRDAVDPEENTAERVGGALVRFNDEVDASKTELQNQIKQAELDRDKNKGIFGTLASLEQLYPRSKTKKDFYAFVGTDNPRERYHVTADGGDWLATGDFQNVGGVDMADYAEKKELVLYLEKKDLIGQSDNETQHYLPDMNGNTVSQKASSILVNSNAVVKGDGTLSKFQVNGADSGTLVIHILARNGNVFTSIGKQNINITTGIAEYNTSLKALAGNYIGIEISPTNASVSVKNPSSIDYYGGLDGTSFKSIPGYHICYGFEIALEQIDRPQEVEVFERQILDAAKGETIEYVEERIENGDVLKRADLVFGSNYEYSPNMEGVSNSQKASSLLINALAKAHLIGDLNSVTINTYDSGVIKVHVCHKDGNIFNSVSSEEIIVKSGINKYSTSLSVTSDEHYIGLEISPTNAGVKVFGPSGKEGYYGGKDGTAFTFISGALVCYGFTIKQGDGKERPREVESFKAEILQEANAKKSIGYSAGHLLYSYDMKTDESDFSHTGWTFSETGALPSVQGLAGKLYIKKQINIETKIQRCIATLKSDTNLILFTEGKEDKIFQTAASVDVKNNTLNIYEIFVNNTLPNIRATKQIAFQLIPDRKYIIELYRLPRANGIRIIDPLYNRVDYLEVSPTQSIHGTDKEVYASGLQYDQFGVIWNSGTAPIVHELSCGYYGVKSPLLYIVGDSITYGYGIDEYLKDYAHSIGALTGGDYVISARGGGKIGGVIERIQTECSIIKPKYIMVTIGTNQAPTEAQLQQLLSAIRDVGAIPIINCIPCLPNGGQSATNDRILALKEYGCRFDLATAIDPSAISLLPDTSLVPASWSYHPNYQGHKNMAERARVDLPFLI